MTIENKGATLETLLDLLKLEKIETDLYRGKGQDLGYSHLFGGHAVAQALSAATDTVESAHHAHSLHGYFLLPGDAGQPIVYQVERIRDGSSFSARRVTALQKGRIIFSMATSFHGSEDGVTHAAPMPDVPPPEEIEEERQYAARILGPCPPKPLEGLLTPKPIEFRMVNPVHPLHPEPRAPERYIWFRPASPLPRDPALARMVLAYATDFYLVGTCLYPHGRTYWSPDMLVASLDHAVWFHRAFSLDDWLLYAMTSPSAAGGRGLGTGRIYTREGKLVASTAQEGLLRRRHIPPEVLHP